MVSDRLPAVAKMMNGLNICEQAEAYRLLLIMGAVAKSEIVAWADRLIATTDNLPEWLLDVSLAANDADDRMELKLRDLPGEANPIAAAHAAMSRLAELYESDQITPEVTAQMLRQWASSAKVSYDDWSAAMAPGWTAEDAELGHASRWDVVRSINRCLGHFFAKRQVL